MVKRNFPLIVLFLIFAGLLYLMVGMPRYIPEPPPIIEQQPVDGPSFSGRVVMPNLDDIYVLENSAGVDLQKLEKFLQGRAAGLHYLASEHYRQLKKKDREDIVVGIRMTLDSLGVFHFDEFVFSDTEDAKFKAKLVDHINYFWRYPRLSSGKLVFWMPIRWLAKY